MKNKQLKNWALGAEIVSAIAVVVTVAFLAIQIMDNTDATQAQTYQILMQEMNDYRELFTRPSIASAATKFSQEGWDGLTPAEQRQIYAAQTIRWGFYESAYYANKRGILGESEWRRFERAYCRALASDATVFPWDPEGFTPIPELLTDEFVEFIQSTCD